MRHPYGDIPELVELQAGGPLVRIPDRLSVAFSSRVRALVDTAEFQRLAHISQLGLASKIYPGATHTRFEHALGVFHNACRYLWQLGKDTRFAAVIDPHRAEVLLAAALLHDIGHWPFCHPIEDLHLDGVPAHEEFAGQFLGVEGLELRVEGQREEAEGLGLRDKGQKEVSPPALALNPQPSTLNSELAQVLRSEWHVEPQEVFDVLQSDASALPFNSEPSTHNHLSLMRSLLSGPIDIDKMDYLERDSWHCGVPYGRNFDRDRLIQALVPNAAGDGLAITTKGKTAAELMVFARYVMFSEVYWHHAVRAATAMFVRSFYELHTRLMSPTSAASEQPEWSPGIRQLFHQREAEFIAELCRTGAETTVAPLLDGLFGPKRRLHKRVIELSATQHAELYNRLAGRPYVELVDVMHRLTAALSAETGQPLGPTDVLIDAPPLHREIEFRVDVYSPKADAFRPLAEVSPVVAALARTQFDDSVKRVRVFAKAEVAANLDPLRVQTLLNDAAC